MAHCSQDGHVARQQPNGTPAAEHTDDGFAFEGRLVDDRPDPGATWREGEETIAVAGALGDRHLEARGRLDLGVHPPDVLQRLSRRPSNRAEHAS